MALRESEAIILRTYPLGEADRLVSFLSRTQGRLRGVAARAKRLRGGFGATLETLSYVRMWYSEKETRELVRISQCEMLESFLDVFRDYERGLALSLVAEVTDAVLPEHEASDPAFRLVLVTARAIKETGKTGLALGYFLLWTVRLAGWLPRLDRCSKCDSELTGKGGYAGAGHSGMRCRRCKLPGMRALGAESLSLGQRMLGERLVGLAREEKDSAAAAELRAHLLDVIEHQIERKLTTRRLMESHS